MHTTRSSRGNNAPPGAMNGLGGGGDRAAGKAVAERASLGELLGLGLRFLPQTTQPRPPGEAADS